ncbi:hypothetical protein TSTA_119030 [Talaromyces stipitatus ATCC 10500]|uniref:DUF659 domain-containing protein n=1 Tax=Talaromyces stipitatus (strain ATCC 10500 / CBS 375.48 / QM 6759 / NRRL 1006) TaxID=441959 RepID=B8M9Y7_TALSN|nr:uncharacterized protein TSTA_119030 [Talaromyces stipitatus ATCC 10500]EED18139.1 hypothetical protein TSTA_119030 [Talaromyces stipitatus ATCC 10500]
MAEILQTILEELNIEHKVFTIIADNAANNETLMSELYYNLKEKLDTKEKFQDFKDWIAICAV